MRRPEPIDNSHTDPLALRDAPARSRSGSPSSRMKEIRLLVFGGREYPDRAKVWDHIYRITTGVDFSKVTIIHGDANRKNRIGADYWAHLFCAAWPGSGITEKPYPAKWDDVTAPGAIVRVRVDGSAYNAIAGFTRNQEMLDDGKPTHALEAPGGNGTADMRRRIIKANEHGANIQLTRIDDWGTPPDRRSL